MSVYATMYVWETSKQKSTALLMLLALADYANQDTGQCWPGVKELAKKARMKERNAQLLLNRLAEAGEITIATNEGHQTESGRTNLYTI